MRQKKILRKKLKISGSSTLLIICGLFVFLGLVNAQTLSEPQILVSPDTYYALEDVLYIEGYAEPNSAVRVLFTKQGEAPQKFTVRSDSSGQWVLSERVHLSSGVWEIRARIEISEGAGGALSEWSNPRIIRSVITNINIFGIQIKYITIALSILGVIIAVSVLLIYFFARIKKTKSVLVEHQLKDLTEEIKSETQEIEKLKEELQKKDIKEAKAETEKKFSEMRKRLMDKSSPQQKEQILKELYEAEKDIEKKIEDIRQ